MAASDADKVAQLERRLAVSEYQRAVAGHELKRARIEIGLLKQAVEQQQHFSNLPANDAELCSFWKVLSTTEPGDNRNLWLSKAPFIPQDFTGLFIRECYERMFGIMDNKLQKRVRRFAITGTPGIGKSVFLFYLMWRLSRMESVNCVVLHRGSNRGKIFVFKKDVCFSTFEYSRVDKLLSNEATWYLTDDLDPPPGEVQAVTVLVASPARKYYSRFLKYRPVIELNYFPTWNLEELHQCATSLFPNIDKATIEERYSLIGGIPRFVLESSIDLQSRIRSGLITLEIEQLYHFTPDSTVANDNVANFIIHFNIKDDLQSYTVEFASPYVANLAYERFVKVSPNKLLHFISIAKSVPSLGTQLFEQFAHLKLSEGDRGSFIIKPLTPSSPSKTQLQLSEMHRTRFSDVRECNKNETYYIPKIKAFAGIDAVIPNIGWFQVTTTYQNGIKMQPMAKLLKSTADMGIPTDIYFVVPSNIYPDFPKQSFEATQGTDAAQIPLELQGLNQYALCLDIPLYSN